MLVVVLVLICAFFLFISRNTAVYRYRMQLLSRISESATRDIEARRPWGWRFDALSAVTYDEMVFKFWRPLSSFYDDEALTR